MMKKPILAGFAALALTGCVSVLPKAPPPAPRYLIDPVSYSEAAQTPVAWSLVVDDPSSTRVYDSTKIALLRNPGRIEYYANGEWADRAPRLVQAALTRSFENTGRILSVGDRVALSRGNFTLQTDIRVMHAVYEDGKPSALFGVYARLVDARGGVIAAKLFEQKTPAGSDDMDDVAAAFDEAVTTALGEMVSWTFEEADAAYAK